MLKQPDPDEVVEKTNGLNAPLMPDLRASYERGFRPLTDEEKKTSWARWMPMAVRF
jgi:hypothetical protein